MPLFECSKCHCVENTALGNYWMPKVDNEPVLCSECDTGTWHGEFEKKPAAGMKIDQSGFLWSQEEIDAGVFPKHYKIVGTVHPEQFTEQVRIEV